MSGRREQAPAASAPVLVVDDASSTRRLISASLANAGWETVEASSGQRALELIDDRRFAAVVLDVHMPGMDGLDVLQAVRARRESRTLPVILVTSDDEVAERVRGLQAGANDYVAKPFKPDELVARVEAQLRVQQAWRDVVESHLRERAAIASALSQATPEASPEATAELMCTELQALGHLSGVALIAFTGNGVAVPLAARELSGWNLQVGKPLPKSLAAYLMTKTMQGPWLEHLDEEPAPVLASVALPKPATMACAPLHANNQVVGLLVLGADPPGGRATADEVSRVLSEAIDFAAVAGGLLGLGVRNRRQGDRRRAAVEQILSAGTFAAVFQAIVRLGDGQEVGYEALTRFSDGIRPDLRFAEAADVDLGIELEVATMRAALDNATALPSGSFLSVNVSPALATTGGALRELLEAYERPLVLELSEHDPVDDYQALRQALDPLPEVQLSVDDAGSGYSSLRHVLALEPDFVKLDRSWVSGIDSDPARQSLVAGLAYFSGTAGCRLIAEGIESESELRTLRGLGVELGQGFLLGRPEPVDAFVGGNAGPVRAEGLAPGDADQNQVRVLLVDDDPTARHLMRLSLELEGAEVLEAASVGEARPVLEQSLTGVVLDRRLPDGDGLELLAPLEDGHPGIKVVVCSNLDDQGEPVSVVRVAKTNMGDIVRALDLPPKAPPPRSGNGLVQSDAASVAEQWRLLCRQHPTSPPEPEAVVAERAVTAMRSALERAQVPGWQPDPELERALQAFAGVPMTVEAAVGRLFCLRQSLRRDIRSRVRHNELVDAMARLDLVMDWAIGAAATSATESLRHQAFTDPLTGLLNRRAFERDIESEIARSRRYGHALSVIVIDLDGLKAVNDEKGHAAGDERLRSLGRALCDCLRSTDRAYRVGGDEFVVLLPDTGKAVIRSVVARAQEVGAPSFSWGAAAFFDDAADAEQLIDLADQRLFEQRRSKRARQPSREAG